MVQFNDTNPTQKLAELYKKEEERLIQTLAPQYGLEYIDLDGYTINPEALVLIPEQQARAAEVVAFDIKHKNISIALHKPNNPSTTALIEDIQDRGYIVRPYVASTASLEHAYARYQETKNTMAVKKGVLDINPDDIFKRAKSITTPQDVATAITNIRATNSPRRISETLELLFAGALALLASDIHIEPEADGIRLRYRIDGVLLDIENLESHIYSRLMSRLKLLAGMVINQKKEAQDGRFTFTLGEREIEIRASNIPGAYGESMVMRLLDPSVASFSMDRLQLNPLLAQVIADQLLRPNGLIITTGPTGSGKTTALYAFLKEVHTAERKIITIENPVEYKLDGIVQTQTSDDYTFASGLRAILRQDPDVIMVGEIRDHEVAETAMHAAQTGHLVFSTLHTNSAVGGFPRLVDLGVDPHILSSSVNVILGQRLVRLLCTECRTTYQASPEEVSLISDIIKEYPEPITVPKPLTLYKSVGCKTCNNTGFAGRAAVFEAIVMDDAVEEVVIRDPREHIILEAAKQQGIPTMQQDGIMKVLEGITSLAELRRVVDLSISQKAGQAAASRDESDLDITDHIV